jgi:hypothetical protein
MPPRAEIGTGAQSYPQVPALFLVYVLFLLVFKSRKTQLEQEDASGPCYRNMVSCYRFLVTDLQIYGHLLQKYGAIHSRPDLLLQIYGPARSHPPCSFLLRIYGRQGDLGVLLQIYGPPLAATKIWSGAAPGASATNFWLTARLGIRLQGLPDEAKSNTLSVSIPLQEGPWASSARSR